MKTCRASVCNEIDGRLTNETCGVTRHFKMSITTGWSKAVKNYFYYCS